MMSKCAKNKEVALEPLGKCVNDVRNTICHLLRSFPEQMHGYNCIWNLFVLYNKETKKKMLMTTSLSVLQ